MPGVEYRTTFSKDKASRIEFVAKKLHLTPQQLIRQLVDEGMLKYDVFKMAGGILPDAEVSDEDSDHTRERQRTERELAESAIQRMEI